MKPWRLGTGLGLAVIAAAGMAGDGGLVRR